MRILGIDPGLQVCGYACLEVSQGRETLVEAGVLRTDGGLAIEKRLDQIAEDMDAILARLRPELVAVEQLYSHYEHPRTSILMGHARGVILQRCAAAGVEVKSFSATRIKKSVTGNGHAPKQQVQRAIQAVLSLSEAPEPPDVADAMAAALCCVNSLSDVAVAAEETN
jgi:crossover junction endodeoxyribonuclease RuvC